MKYLHSANPYEAMGVIGCGGQDSSGVAGSATSENFLVESGGPFGAGGDPVVGEELFHEFYFFGGVLGG